MDSRCEQTGDFTNGTKACSTAPLLSAKPVRQVSKYSRSYNASSEAHKLWLWAIERPDESLYYLCKSSSLPCRTGWQGIYGLLIEPSATLTIPSVAPIIFDSLIIRASHLAFCLLWWQKRIQLILWYHSPRPHPTLSQNFYFAKRCRLSTKNKIQPYLLKNAKQLRIIPASLFRFKHDLLLR